MFLIGYGYIAMAAMLKKAALFRVFHSAGFWRALSNLLPAVGLMAPLISLWFFLNYEKQLDFTYMQQLYYYEGNLVFTLLLAFIVALIFDRPFKALMNHGQDTAIAERDGPKFKLLT